MSSLDLSGSIGNSPSPDPNQAFFESSNLPPIPKETVIATGPATNLKLSPGWEKRIAILGMGSYGTAIANRLALSGADVFGWARNSNLADELKSQHTNSQYLPGAKISERLQVDSSLQRTIEDRGVLILAIPSYAWPEILPKIQPHPDSLVVSLSKGFIIENWNPAAGVEAIKDGPRLGAKVYTPLQYLKTLPAWSSLTNTAVIAGGGFAKNVVNPHVRFGLSCASESTQVLERLLEQFGGDTHLRLVPSQDPLGVEIMSCAKNIAAIMVGAVSALYDNRVEEVEDIKMYAISEALKLAQWLQGAGVYNVTTKSGKHRVALSPAGISDFNLTCTAGSRNFRLGSALGSGAKLEDLLLLERSVPEGVGAAWGVKSLVDSYTGNFRVLQLVANTVVELLKSDHPAKEIIEQFYRARVTLERSSSR